MPRITAVTAAEILSVVNEFLCTGDGGWSYSEGGRMGACQDWRWSLLDKVLNCPGVTACLGYSGPCADQIDVTDLMHSATSHMEVPQVPKRLEPFLCQALPTIGRLVVYSHSYTHQEYEVYSSEVSTNASSILQGHHDLHWSMLGRAFSAAPR